MAKIISPSVHVTVTLPQHAKQGSIVFVANANQVLVHDGTQWITAVDPAYNIDENHVTLNDITW